MKVNDTTPSVITLHSPPQYYDNSVSFTLCVCNNDYREFGEVILFTAAAVTFAQRLLLVLSHIVPTCTNKGIHTHWVMQRSYVENLAPNDSRYNGGVEGQVCPHSTHTCIESLVKCMPYV